MSLPRYVVNKDGKTVGNPRHLAYAGVKVPAPTPQGRLAELAASLRARDEALREQSKRMIADIFAQGNELLEAKALLGHGKFLPFVKSACGYSDQTARNYMNAARLADKFKTVLNFDLLANVLYQLAAPSTPEEVVDEAIKRAEAGEKVTGGEVKAAIEAVTEHEIPVIAYPGESKPLFTRPLPFKAGGSKPLFPTPPPFTTGEIKPLKVPCAPPVITKTLSSSAALLPCVQEIESLLGEGALDEAAENLVKQKIVDRGVFATIGKALVEIGFRQTSTRQPAEVIADKNIKKSKPH